MGHEAKATGMDPAGVLLLGLGLFLDLFLGVSLGLLKLGFFLFGEPVVALLVELLVLGGDLLLAMGGLAASAGSGGVVSIWIGGAYAEV
jgi:hypothetical protein